jgi:glycosyltransferase involved in cell wall biosynthesis
MKKIVLIAPHLSTGGLPQFLLDKIEILKQKFDVYLIEWVNITGGIFVVQRNKIENILQNKFFSLGENKNEIFDILNNIKPDIIHFEEFPETFVDNDICSKIYSNKDYYITETTHGTGFNKLEKTFIPDKMMFVSKGNFNQYGDITLDSDVIEFPPKWKKRSENLRKLNLDPSFKHVLNVGLFTSGKNQGEAFEIARKLQNHKIQFHFVGNQAGNFKDYWEPIMQNKPENCIVWGERSDVEDFYRAMDLFLYTSKWENRPLSILEALNHDMPTLIHNLHNYADDFARYELVDFLSNNLDSNANLVLEKLNLSSTIKPRVLEPEIKAVVIPEVQKPIIMDIKPKVPKMDYKISAYHILTDIDTEREVRSVADLSQLEDYGIKWNPIISKRYTELPPKETCAFPEIVSMEPGGALTPAHYGCYLGHRKAFETGYKENPDYMLIFECDCILDVPHQEFVNKVMESIEIIEKEDLLLFSFGHHNGQSILEKNDNYYVVFEFIGAHAYLIPRKSYQIIYDTYQTAKWNVADLWMGNNFRSYRQGILPHPITKQAGGISILENLANEDRY